MNSDSNNNQGGMVLGSVDVTQNNTPDMINNPNSVGSQPPVIEDLGDPQVLPPNVENSQNTNINNSTSNNGLVMDGNVMSQEVPPQVQSPQPSYTNPEVINPPPIPQQQSGFQPQNAIGITPPVSLEPEKKPKKPMNKTIFVILVIVALLGVGFGTYYVLNYTDLLTKKEEIVIETKNLELNLGDKLPETIAEYATITGTNVSNCNPVDASEVNINAAGVYKYTITCGSVSKIGTITIIDNTDLLVQTKTVYKSKGQTILANEFASNNNDGLTYEFVNQAEIDTALASETGTYEISLKVSNGSKNTDVTGKLVMLQYPIKGYVTCETNIQNVDSLNASKLVALKFGILDDDKKYSYAGFGYEITTFTFNDVTSYKKYETEFNENGSLTIDGVTGMVDFSTNADGLSVIKFTTELDNAKVLTEYGNENMVDYSTITKHFGKTATGLGYNCTYKKAE